MLHHKLLTPDIERPGTSLTPSRGMERARIPYASKGKEKRGRVGCVERKRCGSQFPCREHRAGGEKRSVDATLRRPGEEEKKKGRGPERKDFAGKSPVIEGPAGALQLLAEKKVVDSRH